MKIKEVILPMLPREAKDISEVNSNLSFIYIGNYIAIQLNLNNC